MMNASKHDPQSSAGLISLSTYISVTGYVFIALLTRPFVLSPLMVLWITPVGGSVQWLAIVCPILIITLVLPQRFSFARAMMAATQGEPFSIRRALRFTGYGAKLKASLSHALRVFLWGVPFFLTLGLLGYISIYMDVFAAVRILTAVGEIFASVLSAVAGFFKDLSGGQAVMFEGSLLEGVYCILGITLLTYVIFIWGIWRCSLYRYLWALAIAGSGNIHKNMLTSMRISKWKQIGCGIYNLLLWLPSLFFTVLVIASVYQQITTLIYVFFETKVIDPIIFPHETVILVVIGIISHLLILPIRRSKTAHLANYLSYTVHKAAH